MSRSSEQEHEGESGTLAHYITYLSFLVVKPSHNYKKRNGYIPHLKHCKLSHK